MGKYRPNPSKYPHMINFYPDDTDESFFVLDGTTMSQVMALSHKKWPDGFEDINITARYIHTRCLTYDLYDAGDYDCYLEITRVKEPQ